MPFDITIDADRRLRITTLTGVITVSVLRDAYRDILRNFDPSLNPGLPGLR